MKIHPSQLESEGFEPIYTLPYDQLMPFIKTALSYSNWYTRIYQGFTFVTLGYVAGKLGAYFFSEELSVLQSLLYFIYGLGLTFILIPLHEFIHVLAYRSQGAKNTAYDVDWKRLIFMAVAPDFVANQKEFRIIALAPFMIITPLLIMTYFMVTGYWQFTILGMLFLHTSSCGGDFGMLSFVVQQKGKDVVTFDKHDIKTAYFYAKDQEE